MKVKSVEIRNFRILENVDIDFDDTVTLVVGRNNTGKTSLTEIFYKFFGGSTSNKFKFEDFSLSSYEKLKNTEKLYVEYTDSKLKKEADDIVLEKENTYRNTLPKIELSILIEYEEKDNLASVSNFIMDLDPARKDVFICCEYALSDSEKLMKKFLENKKEFKTLAEYLKKNWAQFYTASYYAVDSKNRSVRNKIEENPKGKISDVFLSQFITAQRILDDQSSDDIRGLTKGFGDYYKHNNESPNTEDLKTLLDKTSQDLDCDYKKFFKDIFTDLKDFGMNTGLNIQELEIKSKFDIEKVLKDNATLYYKHEDEFLPESHNGLGYSNLIYIILQFFNSFEEYKKRKPIPSFSLLFLEEPEAHLHPQMQQTFIKNVKSFIQKKDWNIQVVITTHSSHIVADSGFENIRYFEKTNKKVTVKNLSEFQDKTNKTDPLAITFLKQYMTLYNCDMFFADKIIMVEGTVERLLLPEVIKRSAPDLQNQYISMIEVGGAYAYKFKTLLDFLNVKTLIITDLDSVKKNANSRFEACPVSDGEETSNKTLEQYFSSKKLSDFIGKTITDKVCSNVRIAYQISENTGDSCGRSFEEAFILKNAKLLSTNTKAISTIDLFSGKSETDVKNESYAIAEKIPKKTDFAFDILLLETFETPIYITESLIWLSKD